MIGSIALSIKIIRPIISSVKSQIGTIGLAGSGPETIWARIRELVRGR